ncbi:HNH endonuclease [Aeromonas phage BUCT695]|uniref:HNH endonuclease n=1 Tax=Aeromonas phage BUCT695 TaxID=2908630 RepID=UPI0023297AF0|nr:HNH endonuclease [Aeromonas phage BUCT695]UIW10530.1 HNH endonuclease [Aeromonas phage BUCT695]
MELLDYLEYSKGKLFWKKSPASRCKVGDEVGNISKSGYREFSLKGKRYYTHRVIWFIHKGTWPEIIDHINNDRLDNRIENLREATQFQNAHNVIARNCTSSYKGVYWDKQCSKWKSSCFAFGKKHFCGTFTSEWEAAEAYNKKALELFGEFAKVNTKEVV